MGLPGVTDQTVYRGLKDVLIRQPEITIVQYEPDSISKERLRAMVAPARVRPSTGPTAPELRVEWRFHQGEPYDRIHYHDPNTEFNCGWHRDRDHPDLGSVHFQYERPASGDSGHEGVQFSKSVPTEILWSGVEQLFETKIPELSDGT